jgi:transposase
MTCSMPAWWRCCRSAAAFRTDHLLVGLHGLPLHALLSAASTHDSKLFERLLETNAAVHRHRHRPGRPPRRPAKAHVHKGYGYLRCRRYLRRRGIKVCIARRGIEDKARLGRHGWVVECTASWLLRFKRLGLRYEGRQFILRPLLTLGCVLINLRRLVQQGSWDQDCRRRRGSVLARAAVPLGLRRDGRL